MINFDLNNPNCDPKELLQLFFDWLVMSSDDIKYYGPRSNFTHGDLLSWIDKVRVFYNIPFVLESYKRHEEENHGIMFQLIHVWVESDLIRWIAYGPSKPNFAFNHVGSHL
jgi:hypothetical protein